MISRLNDMQEVYECGLRATLLVTGESDLYTMLLMRLYRLVASSAALILSFFVLNTRGASRSTRRSSSNCTPFYTTFSPNDIGPPSLLYTPPFVLAGPGAYSVSDNGLELFMDRPEGEIKTKGGVNDVVAGGTTMNSTFSLL